MNNVTKDMIAAAQSEVYASFRRGESTVEASNKVLELQAAYRAQNGLIHVGVGGKTEGKSAELIKLGLAWNNLYRCWMGDIKANAELPNGCRMLTDREINIGQYHN